MSVKKLFYISFICFITSSCTKLDEKLNGTLTLEQAQQSADITGLLKSCYSSFRIPFQDQTGVFCLTDMSSDDCFAPTRGGDWDDNGVWRNLSLHLWDPTNDRIISNFNNLEQIVFNCTNILTFAPAPDIAAQAKFFLPQGQIFFSYQLLFPKASPH